MEAVVTYRPIGFIHTPFRDIAGMPIQPAGARGVAGAVRVDEAYRDGLKDLEGFSHLFLLYHLHLCGSHTLLVKPFLDDAVHGIFACRSPQRPNPIGLSMVRLVRVAGSILHVEDVDMVDGTPLLDIKPHVPLFDTAVTPVRTGWFAERAGGVYEARSDGRFRKEAKASQGCGDAHQAHEASDGPLQRPPADRDR